jgi:hypothetical protein
MDRIQVHLNACGTEKKRKVFDSTKMRVKGTEAESFVKKKKPEPPSKLVILFAKSKFRIVKKINNF